MGVATASREGFIVIFRDFFANINRILILVGGLGR